MVDPLRLGQVSATAVAAPGSSGRVAWRVVMPARWRRAVLFTLMLALGAVALTPLLGRNLAGADVMMGFLALVAGLSSLWSG